MDAYDIRRENARQLAREVGGITAFSNKIGKSQPQASHLIGANPVKNIGPGIARQIERAFGKPHGWLDTLHSVAIEAPSLQGEVLRLFEQLSPERQLLALSMLRDMAAARATTTTTGNNNARTPLARQARKKNRA